MKLGDRALVLGGRKGLDQLLNACICLKTQRNEQINTEKGECLGNVWEIMALPFFKATSI